MAPKACTAWTDPLDRRVNLVEMDFLVRLVWSDLPAHLEAAKDRQDPLALLDPEVNHHYLHLFFGTLDDI